MVLTLNDDLGVLMVGAKSVFGAVESNVSGGGKNSGLPHTATQSLKTVILLLLLLLLWNAPYRTEPR
jgi:hypothetical protein